MIRWLLIDFSVFLCVAIVTGIIIPQILLIAFRKNLFDTPDPRKIHKTEVSRLGGIAFSPPFCSQCCCFSDSEHFRKMYPFSCEYTTTYSRCVSPAAAL